MLPCFGTNYYHIFPNMKKKKKNIGVIMTSYQILMTFSRQQNESIFRNEIQAIQDQWKNSEYPKGEYA